MNKAVTVMGTIKLLCLCVAITTTVLAGSCPAIHSAAMPGRQQTVNRFLGIVGPPNTWPSRKCFK
jgi:hypothetical protein